MSKHTRSVTHSGTNNASTLTLQLPSQAQRIPRKRRKTSTAGCFWSACGGQASLYSDDEAVVTCPAPAVRSRVKALDGPVFEVNRNNMMLHSQAEPVVKQPQPAQPAQATPPITSLRSIRAAHDARKGQHNMPGSSFSNASSLASSSLSPATSSAYLAYTSAVPRSSTPPAASHTHSASSTRHSQATMMTTASSSSSHGFHLPTPQVSSSSLAQVGHSHRQSAQAPSVVVVQPSSPDRKRKREARYVDVDDNSMLYLASLIDAPRQGQARLTMRLPSRAILKKIIRAHLPEGTRLAKNVDLLVYLAYMLFLTRLAGESRVHMQLDAAAGVPGAKRTMASRHVREARRKIRG